LAGQRDLDGNLAHWGAMLSEQGFTVFLRNRSNPAQLSASDADVITEMDAPTNARTLRLPPSRFRRRARRVSVETLMDEIGALTAERQRLREDSAAAFKLERNRVKLARRQWELSHALIERYLPDDSRAA
jgi:hypothetical protein